jgi:hypothetical protein
MIKHLLISFLALSITATAQAGTILNGDIIESASLPSTLQQNLGPESDSEIFLYTEQKNFLLDDALGVDYLNSTMSSGYIDAGIKVNSFVFSFDAASNYVANSNGNYTLNAGTGIYEADPNGNYVYDDLTKTYVPAYDLDANNNYVLAPGGNYAVNNESFEALGSYLFDTKILGIIWGGTRPDGQQGTIIEPGWAPSSGLLDVSDDIFKLSGTTYANGDVGRGLEPETVFTKNNTLDAVTVSNSGYQLDFALYSKAIYADQFRVITAVPEPSTIVLFGAAAFCLLNLRRVS